MMDSGKSTRPRASTPLEGRLPAPAAALGNEQQNVIGLRVQDIRSGA